MRTKTANPTWVVYAIPTTDPAGGPKAVCTQAEWAALERERPGVFALVRADIPTEPEAERLARGTAGADRPRPQRIGLFSRQREEAAAVAPAEPAAV